LGAINIKPLKNQIKIPLLLVGVGLFYHCNRASDLKVETTACAKQISFESTEMLDPGFTTLHILHQGFCYEFIDSIAITRNYSSGENQVYLSDTVSIGSRNIDFSNETDESSLLNVRIYETGDTAKSVNGQITAIYQNQSKSNTLDFSYQLPCAKHIELPVYSLIDTSSCQTDAGMGDRYLISFIHKGYCTSEIDSISGGGDFYSLDGYFWNSSDFSLPLSRIIFPQSISYTQQISFKLCITYGYSDYIENKFWMVYKDGTTSNVVHLDIFFEPQIIKSISEKYRKMQIE